jgi:hypothetical protein
MKKKFLSILMIFLPSLLFSQVVFDPVSDGPVYDLLTELAALKVISLNSISKPYSRIYIAEKLQEARRSEQFKNHDIPERACREIDFFLRDYGFEITLKSPTKQDSLPHQRICYDPPCYRAVTNIFRVSVSPLLGSFFLMNENGAVKEVTGGGELVGYLGKHLAFYTNIQQTWQSQALVKPVYITMEEGKVWKEFSGGVSSTEWRGGVSVAWNWGDFGIYKDRPVWGNAEHGSNILSGHAPSFPFIRLHLKPARWIEFQYIHGWLRSNVIDSARSSFAEGQGNGETDNIVYRRKFIAANIFTVTPWKGLDISVGNSIIYSDVNPNPWYLIPVLFYNSVDAEKNNYNDYNGSNSQMFIDVCSRQIRHLKLYSCLFIDELKTSRIMDPNSYNFTSWKLGLMVNDLLLKNYSFTIEWTKTNPLTYKHFIPTINFENESYNLGQYMRDNSQEIFVALAFKPIQRLGFNLSFTLAQHGDEYIYTTGKDLTTLPVLKNLTWQNKQLKLEARYMIVNKVACFLQYSITQEAGDIQYVPVVMRGSTNTLVAGISLGFF